MKGDGKIETIMLIQPNYSILGKRTWKTSPYNLAILNACLKEKGFSTYIYDPNYDNEQEVDIRKKLKEIDPDLVGITSFSTEYIEEIMFHSKLIKEELSDTTIVLGGVLPTVWIDKVIWDKNIDYFIMGEGEYRFNALLDFLNDNQSNSDLNGISFLKDGKPVINHPNNFIAELDAVPLPDWGNLNFGKYANYKMKYSPGLLPRKFPFATTITSRGCPYKCIFCAAKTVRI